jgi:hypothetical protein
LHDKPHDQLASDCEALDTANDRIGRIFGPRHEKLCLSSHSFGGKQNDEALLEKVESLKKDRSSNLLEY